MRALGHSARYIPQRERGLASQAIRRFLSDPLGTASLLVLTLVFTLGAFSHTIAPSNLIDLSPSAVHVAPNLSHPFGTDELGRDVLVRTLYGVQTTEEIALAAAAIATVTGVAAGALAGYFGGWVDALLMRLADLVTAYPAVILTLAVIVYLGEAYPHNLIVIYGAIMWALVARVVRAQCVSLRSAEFVEAARAVGASDGRVIVRHLLPNSVGTIVVAATSVVGQIVLIDATVEFFGYGLPSAISPSLGNLVSDVVQERFGPNPSQVPNVGWWTWAFPAFALALILVLINLLGDALDASFNPTGG